MKEFRDDMTSLQLRIAYFKFMTDTSMKEKDKKKAKKEYNRLMDKIVKSPKPMLA